VLSARRADGRWTAATVGAGLLALRLVCAPPEAAATIPDGTGPWTATVASVSSPRDGTVPATLELALDGSPLDVAASLPPYPVVGAGDRVTVSGEVRAATRPGDRPRLFVRRFERAAETTGVEALRRAVGDAIARVLPEPGAGLGAGMIVGLRERVDRDLAADFTTAGVSHVVAISGWNVALVLAFVAPFAMRLGRAARTVVLVTAVVGFVVFAGGSASVVRAGAMATIVLVSRATGRGRSASAALAWAIAALVLLDPAAVGDPGLQLSAGATAGLLVWGEPLTGWLSARVPAAVPDPLVESLGLSLAAEAATLPFVLADFGRLSLVAPAANLVVAPLVAPAMAVGALAAVGGLLAGAGLPGIVGVLLGLPAWAVLGLMIGVVRLFAAVPLASLTLPAPLGVVAGVAVAGAIGWVCWRRGAERRRGTAPRRGPGVRPTAAPEPRDRQVTVAGVVPRGRRLVVLAVVGLVLGSVLVTAAGVAARPPGHVRMIALDVGQGDAVLVEADGGSRLLVDGGPDPSRLLRALDERLAPWDRRIDVLVLTHPHEDHAAGLPALVERYGVGAVYEPGMRGPGPGYRAFEGSLAAHGAVAGRLTTGDRLSIDHLDLRVLWPDRSAVPETPGDDGTSINNVSIVLLGTFGGQRLLLAGDIEQGIDPILLARRLPRVDLLKVAHHGSATSSTDPFLTAVRPSVAVVSVGAKNPYGHPSPATIGRLRAHGAEVFRTDRNGGVEVDLDGRTMVVSRERGGPDGQASGPASAAGAAGARAARLGGGVGVPLLGCAIVRASAGGRAGTPGPATALGSSVGGRYDPADDRSHPDRGRIAPAVPRWGDVVPATCAGGGGGRGLAGARRGRTDRLQPSRGGGGGAPPRRRQGGPRRGPDSTLPARRGLGGMAAAARPPGARAPRRRSFGDPAPPG